MRESIVLSICAALVACGGSSSSTEAFHANMTSAQEIPAPTVGAPTPTGTAVFTNNNDGTVSYQVAGSNMEHAYATALQLASEIRKIPGLADVFIPQDMDYPALRLDVDRMRAS